LPSYRLSGATRKDLKDFATYTFRNWGEGQMRKYIQDLLSCCERLTSHPAIGRPSDSLFPGLRRFETGKHVIFYRTEPDQIAVIRILHQQTPPAPESFR